MKQKTKNFIKIMCFSGLNGLILGVTGVLIDQFWLCLFVGFISGFVTMLVGIRHYKLI